MSTVNPSSPYGHNHSSTAVFDHSHWLDSTDVATTPEQEAAAAHVIHARTGNDADRLLAMLGLA